MLFYGNDLTGLLCTLYNKLFIQRLDCTDVYHFRINAFCLQKFSGAQCGIYADTGCHDGNILTFLYNVTLADFKMVFGSVVDYGNG